MNQPPTNGPSNAAPVTHVSGPDFIALQVRDLERATAFYEQEIGLKRTAPPQGVTGVVVFETSTIPFGLREPLPGTDLESGPPGWESLSRCMWIMPRPCMPI